MKREKHDVRTQHQSSAFCTPPTEGSSKKPGPMTGNPTSTLLVQGKTPNPLSHTCQDKCLLFNVQNVEVICYSITDNNTSATATPMKDMTTLRQRIEGWEP